MTATTVSKGRWSLSLTGRFAQFNLTLLLIFVALVVMFIFCAKSPCMFLAIGGPIFLFAAFAGCVVFAFQYYSKHEARPEGPGSSIELQGVGGQKAIIKNPPDSFYKGNQSRELVRAIILGYDADLCPDGRVIGKAADQNYQLYTEPEKKEFMAMHKEMVRGKLQNAMTCLTEGIMPSETANQTDVMNLKTVPSASSAAPQG